MNWKPESKRPRRPGGHRTVLVGSAQRASNQEGRSESERTNRRENPPHEADSSGIPGDVKSSLDLLDDQCRRGRHGEVHASGLPAEVEGGNPGESSSESPEGLVTRQEDP